MLLPKIIEIDVLRFLSGSVIEFDYDIHGNVIKMVGCHDETTIFSEINLSYNNNLLNFYDIYSRGGPFHDSDPADVVCLNNRLLWKNSRLVRISGFNTRIKKNNNVNRCFREQEFRYKNKRLLSYNAIGSVHRFQYHSDGNVKSESYKDFLIEYEYQEGKKSRMTVKKSGELYADQRFEYFDGRIFRSFYVEDGKWALKDLCHYEEEPSGIISDEVCRYWFKKDKLVCRIKVDLSYIPTHKFQFDIPGLLKTDKASLDSLPPYFSCFAINEDKRQGRVISKAGDITRVNQTLHFDDKGRLTRLINHEYSLYNGCLDLSYFWGTSEEIIESSSRKILNIIEMENALENLPNKKEEI